MGKIGNRPRSPGEAELSNDILEVPEVVGANPRELLDEEDLET